MRVDKSEIESVLKNEPAFSKMFVTHILERNARVEEDLVDQLFNSTEKRLARVLLLMANFGKSGKPEPIIAKISQETLAEMIGTTRSRVSHFMNKFRKLGFIDYNGHLEVHSSLLTVILSEQPRSVEPAKSSSEAVFGAICRSIDSMRRGAGCRCYHWVFRRIRDSAALLIFCEVSGLAHFAPWPHATISL